MQFTASSPGSLAAQQIGMPISSYSMAPNWTCVYNNTGDDTSIKEIYSSSGSQLEVRTNVILDIHRVIHHLCMCTLMKIYEVG